MCWFIRKRDNLEREGFVCMSTVCFYFLCEVTHVSPACCMMEFVQGATFSLNVAKVQFNTWNKDLGMTRYLFFIQTNSAQLLKQEGEALKKGTTPHHHPSRPFPSNIIPVKKCPNFKSTTYQSVCTHFSTGALIF